jgi:hypothetical protein
LRVWEWNINKGDKMAGNKDLLRIYDKIDSMGKDLNEKIDRIEQVTSKNEKNTAIIIEHAKTTNGRVTKLETNMEGLDGTLRDHENCLKDHDGMFKNLTDKIETIFDTKKIKNNRQWDLRMAGIGIICALVIFFLTTFASKFIGL